MTTESKPQEPDVHVGSSSGVEVTALKPCPFCGESLVRYEPRREGDRWFQHPTNDCVLSAVGIGDPFVIFESAGDFAKWNRRAASPQD